MSNVSKKKLSLPTVQQPAARWAFVLAVCAALGVVVSYYWRVFYGLDARGVSAAGVTGLCVGLAVLAGAAALALRRVRDFAKKGAACILLCGVLFAFANPPMQTPDEPTTIFAPTLYPWAALILMPSVATPRTWTNLLRVPRRVGQRAHLGRAGHRPRHPRRAAVQLRRVRAEAVRQGWPGGEHPGQF